MRRAVEAPGQFFTEPRLAAWREDAEAMFRAVAGVAGLPADEVDAAAARILVYRQSATVAVFVLGPGAVASTTAPANGPDVRWSRDPDQFDVTYVVRWIQAGRRGEPGGKILDERDDGDSDIEIAWRILNHLKQNDNKGLKAALDAFTGGAGGGGTTAGVLAIYPAVMAAWTAYFGALIAGEWKAFWTTRLFR